MISKQVKEICQEVINRTCPSCNVDVIEFDMEEKPKTTFSKNFLLNLVIRDCAHKNCSFLLKTPLKEREHQLHKEASVYGALPLEQEIAPTCFYCNNDMLVLTNLKSCGYKTYEGATYDEVHVKMVLRKAADLHVLNQLNWLQQSEADVSFLQNTHKQFLQRTKELPLKTFTRDDFDEKLSNLYEEMIANLKPSKLFTNVLNHGDLRNENILFLYKNEKPVDCRLINFNFAHCSPPANDILFFLLNVTSEEERKKHFREYLEYYCFCCSKHTTDKNIRWDDFYLSCKLLLPTNKLRSAYFSEEQTERIITKLEIVLRNNMLSEEDCFTILHNKLNSCDYTLKSFAVSGFSERAGFLGDHFNLKINICRKCKEEQLSFFMKTIPSTPSQREFSISSGAVFKEYRMFTKFVPLLKSHGINILEEVLPKTYLCRYDDLIVQEDLTEQGFVRLNPQLSLGFEEIKTVLKALAKFHAAFIILEEKISKERGCNYRLNQEFQKEFQETFYTKKHKPNADGMNASKTGARASVDAFYREGKLGREVLCKLLEEAVDKQEEYVKPSDRFRNTVGHGDLWVNNMLFRYENEFVKDCRIIDFQSYRYHPPAHDVLCVLYLTTDRDFRTKYFTTALSVYFEELSRIFSDYGVPDVISKEEFEESCRFYKESVLTQTMGHFQVILIPVDVSKHLFENPEELREAFFGNKYEFMLETFAKDANFKRRNEECLLDLAEHFESLYAS